MENILAQAKKVAEEAEIFEVTSEDTQVRFESNRLKHLQSGQTSSAALRLISQGRIGYATTSAVGDGRQLVANALETSRFGTPAKFRFPGLTKYPKVGVFDSAVGTVTTEAMIQLGQEMVDAIVAHTPGILCEGGVSRGTATVRILNSRGGQASYRKSYFSLGIEGTLIEGTDMLFVGESESSCRPLLETKTVTSMVLRQLDLAKRRAAAPSRQMPVIFTPNGVAGALVLPLMSAFNGKTVLEGASPVGKRIGEKLFDGNLSLWDDPTIPFHPDSRPCDDEGIPSQKTPLIENGAVSHFIYDLQTAARAGKKSTGNGARSRGGLPSPSPSAFIIAPGNTAFDEMIKDMKEGLVIEQLLGAEQGNLLGGDFSGNVLLGYKVEKGEIVGRVKDTMISGNVYQLLKKITAIGSEAKWVGGSLYTPPLYLPSISVSSKSNQD